MYRGLSSNAVRSWVPVLTLLVVLSGASVAQVEYGDAKFNLSGTLGAAYSGAHGTLPSYHGLNLTGTGNLTGYYYNPAFASFTFTPYLNRSGSSSSIDSATTGRGLSASLGLFGGSHFPGFISYGKSFSDFSQFGLPGGAGLTTSGSSAQSFAIGWGLLLPDKPTLRANYNIGSSSSEIFGEGGETSSTSKTFSLSSDYKLAGFNLGGGYGHNSQTATYPNFLDPAQSEMTGANSNLNFTAGHSLPMSGSFYATWYRSWYSSDQNPPSTSTTSSIGVSISPFQSFSLNGNINHSDNAFAYLARTISGGPVDSALVDSHSVSTLYSGSANYIFFRRLLVSGFANLRRQTYFGNQVSDSRYGARIAFNHAKSFLGIFRIGVGYTESMNKDDNHNGMGGIQFDAGLNRYLGKWEATADFNYSQDIQTDLVFRTSSGMMYGTSVQRTFSPNFRWMSSFRGSHSGISQVAGTTSRAESFSTNAFYRRYSLGATFNQTSGASLLTASGITAPNPLVPLITENYIVTEGRSVGLSASTIYRKRLAFASSYTWMLNRTTVQTRFSQNQGNSFTAQMQYKVRKLWFGGGYRRFEQVVSAAGMPPRVVNSYSVEITRWFSVF